MQEKGAILSRLKYIFITFLLLAGVVSSVNATHLRAGEIIIERINCQSLTFRITIIVYTDTESGVKFGDGILRLGDGSDPDNDGEAGFVIPEIDSSPRADLGDKVAIASYTYEHTYGAPGKYEISYFEFNRNDGILNMDNSVNTPFFINAEINIDPFLGCNNSPVLLIPPIDLACPGVAFFHNPGAFDPDGDSLSFELIIPKKDIGTPVDNYRFPVQSEFYQNLPFLNEAGTGPPEISIDPVTGEVRWDAPGDVGDPRGREYNITFRVNEWRQIGDEWFNLGFIIRDMQIIVQDCDNERPGLIVPNDTCIVAGTILNEIIRGTDPDFDDVKIEAFSQVFELNSNSATYSPDDGILQSTNPPNDTANVRFNWQTDCTHVRDQPYQVVFKITDEPPNGPKLVSFETWNITVIGPEPEWDNATLDFPNRGIDLTWDPYPCTNAIELQVWRRVDSFAYTPGYCQTGMPEFLGYEQIASLSSTATSYFDDNNGAGLDFGASYCYRLVASFGIPGGGESILSEEICLPPVSADAPVITNVTVDKTDPANGEVTVRWTPPFDIDIADFGTDYRYEVQRGTGLLPGSFTSVGTVADTFFVDTGFETEQNAYAYRIVLYSNDAVIVGPNDPIDTSAVASTVRLEPRSLFERIELFWTAEVPWSNNSQDYPWHYIYRKREQDSDDTFLLIDSVNVNTQGFYYLDSGQYNNIPLLDAQVYCYYVTTKGTYGNPAIMEPLFNDSQVACAQPSDDIPPCVVELSVDDQTCQDFLNSASCDFAEFRNELTWNQPVGIGCQDDVLRYDIYYSPTRNGTYQFLTSVNDTVFIDDNLVSFARCYKVRAVDRSGNVSEFSEEVCFDNCPYFELPNVFTPGNNDGCNDLFSAYSNRTNVGETGSGGCGDIDTSKCARFVKSVNFKVVNRWGKLVYDYQSGGENSIYIDWDGRDNQGRELSSGTYFYIAEVSFDVVDTEEQVQTYKGWVQLIR